MSQINLTRNLNQAISFDDLKQQLGESFSQLENYLEAQTGVYVIQSQGEEGKKPRPTLKKGDLVFDLNKFTGIVTLQQWDGERLISLGFASIVGPLPQVFNETPTGVQNGINDTFATLQEYALETTRLYLNGQRLKLGIGFDYSESANQTTITFLSIIPIVTDTIIIDYNTQ